MEAQTCDPDSTLALYRLALYRQALLLRRAPNADDTSVDWIETDDPQLLHFARCNGWHTIVNLAKTPQPLPPGRVILSSRWFDGDQLPGETTVWTTMP